MRQLANSVLVWHGAVTVMGRDAPWLARSHRK